jgi:glycosyltransferase involved in cell wall biosynthesis
MSSVRVEVVIPTYNEAANIEEVVASALQLGPVFVLDSYSTDGTQELARKAGATVVEHKFEGYAVQKNWGLANLPFQGEWVFILDGDERITPALRDEVHRVVQAGPQENGFYVNRMSVFMGKLIRHGGLYPAWNLRLFRRGKARYEHRSVHEHMICEGATGFLEGCMIHIRRETIPQYLAKHIRYADLESDEWVRMQFAKEDTTQETQLFGGSLLFRQWLRRHAWPYVPFRPLVRFVYMYLIRLGFLDGQAGWHLARLMASYEYMISLLYRDKLCRERARNKVAQ